VDIELKDALSSIRETVEGFKTGQTALQKQVDAIDLRSQDRHFGDHEASDNVALVAKAISESPGFEQMKQTGRGRMIVEAKLLDFGRKTLVSGSMVPYLAVPGIGDSGRPLYGRVRQLLRTLPIETGSAHFIKETAYSDQASPVVEASSKNESDFTFVPVTTGVATIAHWCGISKQLWDDLVELQEFLRTSLLFGLERKFEIQLISGDGTGVNLPGLATTATAFDASLLSLIAGSEYNYADVLRAAILQLAEAGYGCTGFVVSPRDWFVIETTKSSTREYIVGDPRRTLDEILWSLPIVSSPAMANGSFLAGDFDGGAHIRMRQTGTIDISDSHSDFFTKNLYAVRAETRAALVVPKPAAFITGSFASSPV
jgi:HK97 family phage major capsid protein